MCCSLHLLLAKLLPLVDACKLQNKVEASASEERRCVSNCRSRKVLAAVGWGRIGKPCAALHLPAPAHLQKPRPAALPSEVSLR